MPSLKPNTVPLTGTAHINRRHTTSSGKSVPRIFFTAEDDFLLGSTQRPKSFFDDFPWGSQLLDWRNAGAAIGSCNPNMRQRIEVCLSQNGQYFNVDNVKILGPVTFFPGGNIYHHDLEDYPEKDNIPPAVREQFDANKLSPKKPFRIYPHGPWTTSTGLIEDLVSVSS